MPGRDGEDWRRMGQEEFLPPRTALVYKTYQGGPDVWEPDRCLFCFEPFMAERLLAKTPKLQGKAHTAGYTTTKKYREGADAHWICTRCMQDFAQEYGLTVQGGPAGG